MPRFKTGRNDPCPCGSGKKYKRCHGSTNATELGSGLPWLASVEASSDAARVQRERQQGFGKPIISATHKGQRFVAGENRLFHSDGFRTFHDFLMSYIKAAIGVEWGNAEPSKLRSSGIPIILWYQAVCAHQRTFVKDPGNVHKCPMDWGDCSLPASCL